MENLYNEEWRDVVGYEKILEISNYGRVRKKPRLRWNGKEIPYKLLKRNEKASNIIVCIDCRHHSFLIAELVADAFIPLPDGAERSKLTAITIDEKYDFRPENLRWIEKIEAKRRGRKPGFKPVKTSAPLIKKDENAIVQLRKNGEFVRRYLDINEVLDAHPLYDFTEILMCLTDYFTEAYGWIWKYEYIYEKK